jgi:hypothetical protein
VFPNSSTVSVLAIEHTVNGYGALGFVDSTRQLPTRTRSSPSNSHCQRLGAADAGFGVTVQGDQNLQGSLLLDGTDLGGYVGSKRICFTRY